MTARAMRRATEVGVRKVIGAERSHLIVQFIGESVLYVMFSMILAMALTELLLPHFNAFLDRSLVFDYWRDPRFAMALLAFVLVAGVLAGAYPAWVLAAFPPVFALKGGMLAAGSGAVRQVLVVLQFAILIGLLIATALIYRQTRYALEEGLRLDQDQVLLVETSCRSAFKEEVRSLPGVQAAACSDAAPSLSTTFQPVVIAPDGTAALMWNTAVDFGFFELYGLQPVAGRFFSREHGADAAPEKTSGERLHAIVVNETARRRLGFQSPRDAVGRTIGCTGQNRDPCEIIGVVPDYAEGSVRTIIEPAFYQLAHRPFRMLSVKLRGVDVPETLEAIDGLWKQVGDAKPINRVFLDQRVQEMYADITRQTWLFCAFAAIAAFIACLGLFGLSAFTAERRTKEIGVRKAMGAGASDIARLMVWQFTKPVLWATVVAWPLGAWLMNRWLHGFAYHIDLQPWLFVASAAVALLIALLTVSGHCYLIARAKPVNALRDE
jgi:putative ABC transport system permease protein